MNTSSIKPQPEMKVITRKNDYIKVVRWIYPGNCEVKMFVVNKDGLNFQSPELLEVKKMLNSTFGVHSCVYSNCIGVFSTFEEAIYGPHKHSPYPGIHDCSSKTPKTQLSRETPKPKKNQHCTKTGASKSIVKRTSYSRLSKKIAIDFIRFHAREEQKIECFFD